MSGGEGTVDTYGERFEFDIENILREGDLSRRALFEWWLGKDPEFTCGRCWKDFTARLSDIDEDAEIVCPRCVGKGKR